MGEAHPDDEFTYAPGVGLQRRGDDALTKKYLAYYSGERKTKPTAISDQKTMNDAADGTEGRKILNHPQIRKSLPEYLAKHFKNTPEITTKKR